MREEIIGDCRLILGDCRDILPQIGKVDAVVTDPPFEKEAHTPIRRTQKSVKTGIAVNLGFAAISEELRDFIAKWGTENSDGWNLYFCQIEAVAAWRDAIELNGGRYKRGMVWIKPDSSPQFNGQGPAQGFECIVAEWAGQERQRWNGGGRRGVFTHLTNQPDREGTHPTEKPIPLMLELVTLFTDFGDIVCDPFMGSGTTLAACAKTGRKGIGIELDPKYFDLSCRRIEEAYKQPRLFSETPQKIKQGAFL